jgi:hypothetical protein
MVIGSFLNVILTLFILVAGAPASLMCLRNDFAKKKIDEEKVMLKKAEPLSKETQELYDIWHQIHGGELT